MPAKPDVKELTHELEVHQAELEAQNDELRASQAELSKMRDRYYELYDLAPVGYLSLDPSGHIEESNLQASRLLGVERAKLLGRPLQSFMNQPAADSLHRHLQEVFASDSETGCDLVLGTGTADGRPIHIDSLAVLDSEGKPAGCRSVLIDASKLRAAEEDLRQSQKLEAVGALASSVAHDFNNVLQAILGCINVARGEHTPPERARRFLDRAAHAARRGGDLAKQLMAFTRKQRVEPRPIRIDALVAAAAPLLQRLVTEQVTVEIETHAPGARLLADPVQLDQILMNLASNARDAMPDGGTLSIRTDVVQTDASRFVCLVVEDSGTGMTAEVRSRMFDPFFTTKEVGKGTGLGLSSVFAVTQQLGGQLEVESEPGSGTTFAFTFPCTEGTTKRPSIKFHKVTRFSGTALLVEDDELVRMAGCHYLEELGLDVLEAADADEALALCEQCEALDVLVSDVVLPGMRGPQLVRRLRKRYPSLPVLFVTANPEFLQPGEVEQAAVLPKPFGKEELADELDKLIGAAARRVAQPPAAQSPAGLLPTAGEAPAQQTILLVEDDPLTGPLLAELLEEHGHRVLLAAKPSEALARAADHDGPIALLLSDVRLPEMNGGALAEQLLGSRPDLRVVFMSALPDPPAGAAAYIQKPIDFDKLVTVVDQQLEQV